jgi:hypothetical protein
LCVLLRKEQIVLTFFLRKHLNFDTMNVPVVYKGQMNKNLFL